MAAGVYILGSLLALICGVLLIRGYVRGRKKLLLWSSLCFIGLSLSNLLVFFDLVMFPDKDLYVWRLSIAALAMLCLLYGLIWEGDS
jgi:hypothetical protein